MSKKFSVEDNLEFLTATLSSIGDGVIITDFNGKIVYLNHSLEEIIQSKAAELIGKDFDKAIKFVNEDTKEVIKSPVGFTLVNDTITGLEHNTFIITNTGTLKYVSATCSPVKNAQGTMMGAVIVLRDITRLITLEQEHINEKNNLRALFNNAPVGMIMIDDNANVIQVNDTALLYINKEKEKVCGDQFGNSFNCNNSYENNRGCGYGHKCNHCDLRKGIELSIQYRQETKSIEFRSILIVDGNSREFWFRASITPIIASGKKETLVTLMDITESKHKEMDIAKSRDYCINILDQIPSLVWKTDTNMEYNYFNKVWYDFTGLSQAAGFCWANAIHPEDLDKCIKARKHAMETKDNYQLEYRVRRYDGEYRWCLAVGAPYNDLDGNYAGYIGSIYDISELKDVEDDLKRYRKTINNARDIILFLDLDGNIIEANEAAIEAYGYTNEELCSMNIRNIRDNWGYTQHQLEQANRKGVFFEATHRRKDGSTFQVEVSSQGTYFGKQRIIFSVVRDVTERKKIEKNVLDNQLKYRSLFMNMKTGYAYYRLIYDDNHKPVNLMFIEVNEAFQKFFGLSKSKIIGKNHSDLFPDSALILMEYINKFFNKLVKGKSVQIDDYYSQQYDKWFEVAIYSPKENDIVIIITDITHIKDTEKKLIRARDLAESANKAKSEFLANMSHEIRTPINGIVGMIDLTMLTELSIDQRDNLLTAKVCANALLKIINDILDFSKLEAGKVTLENISFNIKNLLVETVKTHSSRINEKGLELHYTFSSSIPPLLTGDPNRLRQILNNLISNAIKFTEKGYITISILTMSEINDEVELKFIVSDTGIGISPGDIKRLFQSFSQLENSFTKEYGGSGLGLAISKNLIELMGGRIEVESEKGKGSSFYFSLKFKVSYDMEQNANCIPKITKPLKQLKILLVEDDFINQKVISKMLSEKGHAIDTANNGLEALELFEQNKYDVILMDIQMPKMNGVEAISRLKEKEGSTNHTPVIALTAYALQGDRERFLDLGFDGYVSKPIQMSELFYNIDKITELQDEVGNATSTKVARTYNDDVLYSGDKLYISSNMISQKLACISEDIDVIESAIKNDDLMIIEKKAHDIKLLSIEISAMNIKHMAFRIELAARKGNFEEINHCLKQIKVEMKIYDHYSM